MIKVLLYVLGFEFVTGYNITLFDTFLPDVCGTTETFSLDLVRATVHYINPGLNTYISII